MSPAEPPETSPYERSVDWQDDGDSNWSATAPGGWPLVYAAPRFNLLRGQGYSRATNEITLQRRGQATACLLREGPFDQLAKRLGYAVEHQTGDPIFDRRIYLATDDPAVAGFLADRPNVRQAVLDLFEADVRAVNITATGWTMRLGEAPDVERDDGHALSVPVLRLCALSDLWPDGSALPASRPRGRFLRGLSLAWFGVVAATVFARWRWGGDTGWERQVELFAETDWLGMGLLALAAVGPFALLGGRRASSHRVLALLILIICALLPISERLLQIDLNRLQRRDQVLVAALPTSLRPDPERAYSKGYLITTTIEDRPLDWALSPNEGKLALEGRLCMAGVVAEGLRGLRYVKALRTWTCRPGETSQVPPLTETSPEPT